MARNRYDIDEKLESPFDIKHFKRAGVYLKKYRGKLFLGFLASCLGSVAGLFSVTLTGTIIDKTIPEKDTAMLFVYGLILLFCMAASIALAVVRMRIMALVGQNVVFDMRNDLYRHMQKLSFSYFDSRPHGKILVRVISYVNSIADVLSNGIVNFILDIFNIAVITVFMFAKSVRLSLVAMAGVPFVVAFSFILRPVQVRRWRNSHNKASNQTAFLAENISGVKVTQIFTREDYNLNILRRLSDNVKSSWIKAVMCGESIGVAVDVMNNAVVCAIYGVSVLVLSPAATLGTIMTMVGYVGRFWQPIVSLAVVLNSFLTTVAYLERIFEMMDEKIEVPDKPGAKELPPVKGAVEFRDVRFGYEPGVEILHGISFRAEPGQSVAIVGPTGSGKTTIVSLISRFYDVTGGQVLIDGVDVSDVTLRSLRSQMGIMMQESFMFSGTVESNIKYGKLDAGREEVTRAAKTVAADAFISGLPKGYDTKVTERVSGLSQGQKQLIAFARTVINDPRILILDEATSSIDTKTERELQKGIESMMAGRTSFIIAHRLSTIMNCDIIMYIDKGNIIEMGSHALLMAKKGAYYRLVTASRA